MLSLQILVQTSLFATSDTITRIQRQKKICDESDDIEHISQAFIILIQFQHTFMNTKSPKWPNPERKKIRHTSKHARLNVQLTKVLFDYKLNPCTGVV